MDFYGTGFGLKVFSSRANRSGFENSEWLDAALSYRNSLFEGETYAMDYTAGWVYYNYPDGPRKAGDMQEAFVTFFWSNICPAGFDLGNNLTFTPGVYYQLSMDDSVNDDETWCSLSMTYKF